MFSSPSEMWSRASLLTSMCLKCLKTAMPITYVVVICCYLLSFAVICTCALNVLLNEFARSSLAGLFHALELITSRDNKDLETEDIKNCGFIILC